jgi:hypothetical protein
MNNHFIHPRAVADLAAGKHQSKSTLFGKRQAYGEITYSGNFSPEDTVIVNGVTFTAKGSGAAGNQFNIAGTLTLSLDALVTVLNASADAAVAKATYAKGGSTKLTVTYDAYGAAGNAFTLGGSVGTKSAVTLADGLDADVVSLDKSETKALVTLVGALNVINEFDLPAGEEGQEQTFYLKTKGAGANAQVNGAFVGGTKITLDTAGKMFKVKFLNASWQPIVNTGTLA